MPFYFSIFVHWDPCGIEHVDTISYVLYTPHFNNPFSHSGSAILSPNPSALQYFNHLATIIV